MSRSQLLIDYFDYTIRSRGKFSVHSPFVYQFYTDIIRDNNHQEAYKDIEDVFQVLKSRKQLIEVTDFGANSGGRPYQMSYENVGSLAKSSAVRPRVGRLLHRIARWSQADSILELGTSFGISTMYLASGASKAKVHTLEGCSARATKAIMNFDKLGLGNIQVHIGQFDILLNKVISGMDKIDILFLDGNHRQGPTIKYFESCAEKATNDSIFIIDDIRWSNGMKKAWEAIKKHPGVTVSIDLFSLGIVFFRKESSRQDFLLKF